MKMSDREQRRRRLRGGLSFAFDVFTLLLTGLVQREVAAIMGLDGPTGSSITSNY